MSDDLHWFEIVGIYPIQWQVGVTSAGRKNGKIVANRISKPPELAAYQEAVKEYMLDAFFPDLPASFDYPQGIRMEFYFVVPDEGRNVRDTTNFQKALEDALQGILYRNDRTVRDVRSVAVAVEPHEEPRIIIGIGPAHPHDALAFGPFRRSWER